jgi:hypothetical protein
VIREAGAGGDWSELGPVGGMVVDVAVEVALGFGAVVRRTFVL